MPVDTVAVIIAGGEARRLGGIDKTLLPIGGVPLLSILLDRLRPQIARIALGANGDPARFDGHGLPVLADRLRGIGPLGGLSRALEWAEGEGAATLLTIPGDTPFIPSDLLARLCPAAAVACHGGRRHHLVALWPVSCRAALDLRLAGFAPGERGRVTGVRAFADTLGMREVDFDDLPVDPFFNVNTPEDHALAQRFEAPDAR